MPAVGGIAGYGNHSLTNGNIIDCSNSGNITFSLTNMGDCSSLGGSTAIGGINGLACGDIKGCTNKGNITVTCKGTTGGNKKINVGGIAGKDNEIDGVNSNTSVSGCENEGAIAVDYDYGGTVNHDTSNSTVAGIFGWPGKEANNTGKSVSECTNTGSISVSGSKLKARIGGITGGMGNISNSTNSGAITAASNMYFESNIGGLMAYYCNNATITGSTNTGNITVSTNLYNGNECGACGGLIGNVNSTSNPSLQGCKVDCTVNCNSTSDKEKITGMLVGKFSMTGINITLGTSGNKIKAYGTLNNTALTSSNYKNNLIGTSNPGRMTVNLSNVIFAQ